MSNQHSERPEGLVRPHGRKGQEPPKSPAKTTEAATPHPSAKQISSKREPKKNE